MATVATITSTRLILGEVSKTASDPAIHQRMFLELHLPGTENKIDALVDSGAECVNLILGTRMIKLTKPMFPRRERPLLINHHQ